VLATHDRDELSAWLAEATPYAAVAALHLVDAATAANLLYTLEPARRDQILAAMPPRDCYRCLRVLDDERRTEILDALPATTRREVRRILAVPERSAAGLAEVQRVLITPQTTVAECQQRIKGARFDERTIYVTEREGHLAGMFKIADLLGTDPSMRISELMKPVHAFADELATHGEVVALIARNGLDTLPVVDSAGDLVGVVKSQRLFDAVEADALADVQTMVGASKDEHALSSWWFAVRKRHAWLQVNLLTAFLAASVVGLFEGTIAKFTALAVLLPVVAGQSGVSGSQAVAVTMRGLALRQIGVNGWVRALRKELAAGILNGLGIATVTAAAVFLWSQSAGLSLVIGVAMVSAMAIAGVAGALIPIALVRFGQDPATSSSIILTTVTDVAGFMSFLGIATALSFLL
jgi:magnesium transporter